MPTSVVQPIAFDSAVSISGRSGNAAGVSSAHARADHKHAIALAVTNASSSPHALATDTGVLLVDTSTIQIDVQLPDPATVTALLPVLIVDAANNAAAKEIHLLRAAAEKVDGVAATRVLAVSGGRWWLWTDGVDWYTAPCLPVDVAKLAGIEAGADVTDAANVAAAGALMTDGSAAMAGPLTMSGEDIVNAGTVDADVLRMPEGPSDASAEALFVKVYAKDASGVSALYARTDDGAVSKLTGGPETVVDATTARNMATADHAKTVVFTDDTGPNVVTVPDGVKVGTTVEYVQGGDGQVQIAAGGSMVLRHGATFQPRTAEKWSSIVVTVISSTDALVRGDLEAV